MKLNEFVDKIYCINLDRRPDRWKRCQEIFRQHNLDVERFSAIDGTTLNRYNRLKPGEIGVSRSNLAIIKQAKKNHYKSICIFEDDVELADDFNQKFSEYIQEVPDDWAFIYLGGANKRPAIPVSVHIYKLKRMSCAYAMIIHNKIYDVIIKELTAEERWADVNYNLLQRIYPAYVTIPYLAWVRDGYSDIENRIVTNNHSREYNEYKEWV